jgi:hypothetical protein
LEYEREVTQRVRHVGKNYARLEQSGIQEEQARKGTTEDLGLNKILAAAAISTLGLQGSRAGSFSFLQSEVVALPVQRHGEAPGRGGRAHRSWPCRTGIPCSIAEADVGGAEEPSLGSVIVEPPVADIVDGAS